MLLHYTGKKEESATKVTHILDYSYWKIFNLYINFYGMEVILHPKYNFYLQEVLPTFLEMEQFHP